MDTNIGYQKGRKGTFGGKKKKLEYKKGSTL